MRRRLSVFAVVLSCLVCWLAADGATQVVASPPSFIPAEGDADSGWFDALTDEQRGAVVAAVAAGRTASGDVSLAGLSDFQKAFGKALYRGEGAANEDGYNMEGWRRQMFRLRQLAGYFRI